MMPSMMVKIKLSGGGFKSFDYDELKEIYTKSKELFADSLLDVYPMQLSDLYPVYLSNDRNQPPSHWVTSSGNIEIKYINT